MKIKLKLRQIRFIVLVLAVVLLAGGIGWWLGTHQFELKLGRTPQVKIERALPVGREDINFSLFWDVWDRVEQSFLDKSKIDPAKMVYGAISGMVSSLEDPYTVFLPPQEQKLSKEDLSGAFGGVGIQLDYKDSKIVVIAPLSGTPAEKSGVKAGDLILRVKDENKKIDKETAGMSVLEMKFGDRTSEEWDQAVALIISQEPPVKGVILDLRNNPGGYLSGSVFIGSEFLSSGLVVQQEHSDGRKETFSVNRPGKLTTQTLVVLVNKGTASASEIVAGALQEYERAKIVGETTFGKGTIQEAQDLLGGSGLHITTARWLLPSGKSVDKIGVTPDNQIKDDPNTEEDEQLSQAIKTLTD
ncbi:MAG: carboxyl-terminal processing protease [Microgenomates group bacterium LiPW_31]|nr:MAG: carboxyl-terminal processing protease [Microgenomates group bacterium LiPW_31]